MATAGAQWLIERGVVDPRRLREMPSVNRRRFGEIAEAIRGESLGAPASICWKATWQVLLEKETQISGRKWYDLKGRWAAGCEAIFNDTLHWTDPMWNQHANRGSSEHDLDERKWPGVASHTEAVSAATCTNTVVMGEVGGQDLEHPDTCICFFKNCAYQISLRSGVKRPVRRLEIIFGTKVYKIGTLDLEAA